MRDRSWSVQTSIIRKPSPLRPKVISVVPHAASSLPTKRGCAVLLNTRTVEWIYSQISDQLGPGELKARSGFIKQIPVPDLNPEQKDMVRKLVDYLIYLRNQPTTNGKDLAHARDFLMLKYFERIINGLVYEFLYAGCAAGWQQRPFQTLDEGAIARVGGDSRR